MVASVGFVGALVIVALVNVGVKLVPTVMLFPLRVIFTLLPLINCTVSLAFTDDAVSPFACNLNV